MTMINLSVYNMMWSLINNFNIIFNCNWLNNRLDIKHYLIINPLKPEVCLNNIKKYQFLPHRNTASITKNNWIMPFGKKSVLVLRII
jgi:hypothetical protein